MTTEPHRGATGLPDTAPWRSLLYVPVTVQRFVRKAPTIGADALILDLEDSIAPSNKDDARGALADAVHAVRGSGADILVRVNRPLRHLVRDLESAVVPGVDAIAVTKVPSPGYLRLVDETLSDLEADRGLAVGSIRLVAMIETAQGLAAVHAVAHASDRTVAMTLGTEDFALSVGVDPEPDLMAGATRQVVAAARSADLWPLGLVGSISGFTDLMQFRDLAALSRRSGCVGAAAIHPVQIPILNEEFTPSDADVDRARRILDAYRSATASGRGAVSVDGRMVDAPIARRAGDLVRRAQLLRRRDERGSER